MANIIIPSKKIATAQPTIPTPIAWANPITKDLRFLYNAATISDDVGQTRPQIHTAKRARVNAGWSTVATSPGGVAAFNYAGRTDCTGALTVFGIFQVPAGGLSDAKILSLSDSDTANNPLRLTAANGVNNGYYVIRAGNSGVYRSFRPSSNIVLGGQTVIFAITYADGNILTAPTFYQNGVTYTSTVAYSSGTGNVTGVNFPPNVGDWNSTGLYANIVMVGLSGRAWTAKEYQDFYNNPWLLYQAPSISLKGYSNVNPIPVIPRTRVATAQPTIPTPINRGNPITNGLIGAWTLNSESNNPSDLTGLNPLGTSYNSPTRAIGPFGEGKQYTAASSQYSTMATAGRASNYTDLSISFFAKVTATQAQYVRVLEKGTNNEWSVSLNETAGSGLMSFIIRTDNSTRDTLHITWVADTWTHYAFSWNTATDTMSAYINGVRVNSSTGHAGAIGSNATNQLNIGRYGGGGYYGDFAMCNLTIFRRALNGNEINSLYQNPWQLYQAPSISLKGYSAPAGETATATVVIPRTRVATAQPTIPTPINRGNPITNGLVGSWTPNDPGIIIGTLATKQGSITNVVGRAGYAWRGAYQDSNNYYKASSAGAWQYSYNTAVTFEVICRPIAFQPTVYPYISGLISQYVPGNLGPVLRFNYNGAIGNAAKPTFGIQIASTEYHAASSTALSTDTVYHIVGTYNGTVVKLYVDGVEVASNTVSGSFRNDASTFLCIGTDYPDAVGNNRCFNGDIYLARVYKVAKTAAEVKSLAANPWQLYQAPSISLKGYSAPASDATATVAITTLQPTIAGSATGSATAAVAITTLQPTIAGSATGSATAAVAITTLQPTIAGSATGSATAAVAITTLQPTIAGSATGDATATVAITTLQPTIAGSATGDATATVAITTLQPTIAGSATGDATTAVAIPRGKIRTSQPDNGAIIDRSNPLTSKLIIASIPVGKQLVNIVNGTHAVETQSGGGGTNPVSLKRDAIAGNGFTYDGLWHKFSNQNFNPNNPFTIICTAHVLYGNLRSYNGLWNVGTAGDFFLLQAQPSTTILYSSTIGYISTGVIPVWDGLHTIAVVSYGGTTSIYWDGVLIVNNVGSGGWSRESTDCAFAIGDDPGYAGNDGWPGSIYTTQVYAEALPAPAIESLSKNPWQVFATPNSLAFSGTSAPAGETSAVAITTLQPTISGSATGSATAAVAITTLQPTISGSATGSATATVAITTLQPTIAANASIGMTAEVAITTLQPTISGSATGSGTAAVAITTLQPTIAANASIGMTAEVAITTLQPTIAANIVPWVNTIISTPLATLTGAAYAPSLIATLNIPLATLTSTAYAPSLIATLNIPLATLTSTAYEPSLIATINMPLATLTSTAYAPSLIATINIPLATLTSTAYAPSLIATLNIPLATLAMSAYIPTCIVGVTVSYAINYTHTQDAASYSIRSGSTFSQDFLIKQNNNIPMDLTGSTISAKMTRSKLVPSIVLPVTIVDGLSGKINISLSAATISTLLHGNYMYSVIINTTYNKRVKILEGIISVF